MSASSRTQAGGVERLPCGHVAQTRPVQPHSSGCPDCQRSGDEWVELWLCLSCGWVACSDASPNQHAKAHYEETDHPIAVPLGRGRRWCHVHRRAV